jgi:hypothetical protein
MDIEKLPRWARNEIVALRRENEALKEELRIATGKEETRVYYQESFSVDGKNYIPDRTTIYFRLGENKWEYVYLHIDSKNNLRVYGHNAIKVLPQASNLVYIRLEND